MNRRAFLGTSGSAAVVASGGFLLSRKSAAQSSVPSVYGASQSAHAIASANGFTASPPATDWTAIGNSLSSVASEWAASNRDAAVQSICYRFSAASISSSAVNQAQILAAIQVFQPSYTLGNVQASLAYVDEQTAASKQAVINTIASQGMSFYINQLIAQAPKVSNAISSTSGDNTPSARISTLGSAQPLASRPFQPPPGEGGGYNCATDGALVFTAGLAFLTLSVMTMGAVDVLAGAAWGGIALWGSLGSGAWGIGHVVAGCGF